jgi:hypothetical protein
VEQAYFLVKPDNFIISPESFKVHGISQEEAERCGQPIHKVLMQLKDVIRRCTSIVAHNIAFDSNVILSECWRLKDTELIELIKARHHICTMQKGREVMNIKKYPKLSELYKHLYGEDMQNAHNALADTTYCYKCFMKMFPIDKSIFFFKNKVITLTEEQQKVVYEDMNTSMLVVASAGSGKTLTTLTRIKYLIDNGVNEDEIIMTTFTCDAANEMKTRLSDMMGYKTSVRMGTIDGLSKFFVANNASNNDVTTLKHVGEYGYDFLALLKSKPSLIKQYKYIFVDEYQDINHIQYEIIKQFYSNGVVLFAVGDDAQNIYSFRGSDVQYMLHFSRYFPDTKTYMLTTNFRSCKTIVDLANACMECHEEKIAKTMIAHDQGVSQKPSVRYFQNQTSQATFLVAEIKKCLANGICEDEIAILSPINQSLFSIEECLTKENIPNVCLEGRSDTRVMKRRGHVCLGTIHKAKGLEWDVVFFINASDDIIPKLKNAKSIGDDRRLFYVAITRAKKQLHITYTAKSSQPYVSRFITELPRTLYTFYNFNERYVTGQSPMDFFFIDKTVDKLLELLDAEDFVHFKNSSIIPMIDMQVVRSEKHYESLEFDETVTKEGLHSDMAIFVQTYLFREIEKKNQTYGYCKFGTQVLALIVLDHRSFEVYKRYLQNFKSNIDDIHTSMHPSQYKRILERNCKEVKDDDVSVVCYIVDEILNKGVTFGIQNSVVPVFSSNIIPDAFARKIAKGIELLKNEKDNNELLDELWDISKCKRAMLEQRRRLIFKDATGCSMARNNEKLIMNLTNVFRTFMNQQQYQKVFCCKEFKSSCGIQCIVDVMFDKTLFAVKFSNKDEINLPWIVALLAQKALCDENGHPVEKIVIFNALKGVSIEIDVSNWKDQQRLLSYLLEKRDKCMQQTVSSSS